MAASGFASDGVHLVRFLGVKPDFLWYEYLCTDANSEVVAELSLDLGGPKIENSTQCQNPIENMDISILPAETEQKPEWEPNIYMKSTETYIINIVTSNGLPITRSVKVGSIVEILEIVDEGKNLCH